MGTAHKRSAAGHVKESLVREAYLTLLSAEHNARSLAAKLGVSLTTSARIVDVLRRKLAGQSRRLVSVRTERGWHYDIQDDSRASTLQNDPLLTYVIPASRVHSPRGKFEDGDYDTD